MVEYIFYFKQYTLLKRSTTFPRLLELFREWTCLYFWSTLRGSAAWMCICVCLSFMIYNKWWCEAKIWNTNKYIYICKYLWWQFTCCLSMQCLSMQCWYHIHQIVPIMSWVTQPRLHFCDKAEIRTDIW